MMLYEAVQFQRSEIYHHNLVTNHNNNRIKEPPKTVNRVRSAGNVQRLIHPNQPDITRTGSFVVGQKLRESKWFTHEEMKVLCAVVETGFILQRKDEEDEIEYGIAVWNAGQEKSKDPDQIKIYSLYDYKGNHRIKAFDLLHFWPEGTKLRIFNQSDKTDTPHTEEIIRSQIAYAEHSKQKWHSTEHFTYWCRYGPVQINHRIRNMTDAKWGTFGINAGIASLKNKIKKITHGK